MIPVQENLTLSRAEQQKLDMLATDALRGIHARYRDILLAQQRQLIGRADQASTPAAAARDRYLGELCFKTPQPQKRWRPLSLCVVAAKIQPPRLRLPRVFGLFLMLLKT